NRRLIVTMMYGEHKPDNISLQAGRLLDWGFALPRTAAPVGTLVSPAAAASPSGTASPSGSAAAAAQQDVSGNGSPTSAIALLGAAALALVLAALVVRILRRRA
ncbi:MAG TPA: penicillin-binding protein, partial [Mycobacteriales bacterium]|nr:penicillin-binding protein [Mycobacteriales bacterium]